MSFPYGVTVTRDRRVPTPDPYNPDRATVPGWGEADANPSALLDSVELVGVYLAASSTVAIPDAVRTQSQDYQSLYSDDPDVDVAIGDRIRYQGNDYYVQVRPQGDRNPFTGWSPGVEIPLVGTVG